VFERTRTDANMVCILCRYGGTGRSQALHQALRQSVCQAAKLDYLISVRSALSISKNPPEPGLSAFIAEEIRKRRAQNPQTISTTLGHIPPEQGCLTTTQPHRSRNAQIVSASAAARRGALIMRIAEDISRSACPRDKDACDRGITASKSKGAVLHLIWI